MSWVNDEAEKAKQEDENKASYAQSFNEQSPGIWNGLKHKIAQDVEIINRNEDLVKRRLGGSKLHHQEDGEGVKIVKDTYPAIYLTINSRGRFIEISRKVVTNGENRRTREEREVITMDMELNGPIVLMNEAGEGLNIADASKHILLPLLHTNLIK